MISNMEYIRNEWGKKSIKEISSQLGISPFELLENVMNFDIKTSIQDYRPRRWEQYEIDFLKKYSSRLTTVGASHILLRSRYAIYMKAKQLGLNEIVSSR